MSGDFDIPAPEPRELPLPYFVDGDILGIVGQNKIFRYVWMFLVGAPIAAFISNLRYGRVPMLPIVGTAAVCLAIFAVSWILLSAGYSSAQSAPMLFNRRTRRVFLGRYDTAAGRMVYRSVPFDAIRFESAFGGFGSSTLNIKVLEEGAEPWELLKFSRLIDRRESGDLSSLLSYFMNGSDVIKNSRKAAAEYKKELKKRPSLPSELEDFLA